MDRLQLKTLLAETLADVTGESFSPLDDEQTLRDSLNIDSLEMASLAIALYERIGITIEVAEMANLVTIGDLVGLLQAKLSGVPAKAA